MSGQTVYQNQLLGYPGQRVGMGHQARSLVNDAGAVRQVDTYTVDVATDGNTYQITLEGIVVAIVAAANSTKASIAAQLVDALRARQEFEGLVAFNPSGADAFTLTAVQRGVGFTSVDSGNDMTKVATVANVATASIPWGRAVVVGASSDNQTAKLPSATGQKFRGVADRLPTTSDPSAADAGTQGKIAPFMEFSAVYQGQIIVEVDEAVAVGDDVYFRHTTDGADDIGTFRNDADTNKADQIVGAVFETATSGAGLAVITLKA